MNAPSNHPSSENVSLRQLVVADRLAGMRNVQIAAKHGILTVTVGYHLRKAVRYGEVTAEQLRIRPWKRPDPKEYNRKWIERVKAKCITDANGCWLFQGWKNYSGYGLATYHGRNFNAHRAMYIAHFGVELETEQYVLHRCDVRNCVNPEHLFIGSAKDNNNDCATKGRHFEGSKEFCDRGHPLSGDNVRLRWQKGGKIRMRVCIACERINHTSPEYKARAAARRAAKRAQVSL